MLHPSLRPALKLAALLISGMLAVAACAAPRAETVVISITATAPATAASLGEVPAPTLTLPAEAMVGIPEDSAADLASTGRPQFVMFHADY